MTAAATCSVTIKINEDIKARIQHMADARHRTPHGLMREAITLYIEREDQRASFRQDTLNAWE